MDNLLNDEVYLETLNKNLLTTYIEKIQNVIQEFLAEKNKFNIVYIDNGIKTILHIMFNIFINTKNIDITVYYGKLSITYYIEFLNQINSNNTNTFINLTLKDAILFVYKKTIFNLNTEYKKRFKSEDDSRLFDIIFSITNIINRLHIYNDYTVFKYKSLMNQLVSISNKIDIHNIENLILLLINKKIEILKILSLISILSKKNDMTFTTKNIYTFAFLPNYTNKQLINHLLSI